MKCNNSGFSMIEVLVAATIMIMVVMMLGMIFQQSSQAWRTGKHRADTYQQVRALFGAIQRDASMAVDEKALPKSLLDTVGKGNQRFEGSSLSFYTLSGSGFDNDNNDPSGTPLRALTFVTYSSNGKRTTTRFPAQSGGGFGSGVDQEGTILDKDPAKPSLDDVTFLSFNVLAGFPAYITVSAKVNNKDKIADYDVGAASGGPDLTLGKGPGDARGRDDIKTWVN